MQDKTFEVLDKFLKPIVKKEAWFARRTEVAKDLLSQRECTSQVLLSNDFVQAVNSDHTKHEHKKKEKKAEIYQELRKQVLRPETQSLKDISATGLPRQGSLQISFKHTPRTNHSLLSSTSEHDTQILDSYDEDDEPQTAASSDINTALNEHHKHSAANPMENQDSFAVSSDDDYVNDRDILTNARVQDSPRNLKRKSTADTPGSSVGMEQVCDVLTKSQQQLAESAEPSAAITILKQEASASTLCKATNLFNAAAIAGNEKSSRDTASSGWTLKRFSKLVTLDNFDFAGSIESGSILDIQQGEFEVLCDQLKQALKIYCVTMGEINVHDASCFAYLHHTDTKESLIKLFMNHIVGLLCVKKSLKVHHEFLLGENRQQRTNLESLFDKKPFLKVKPRSDYILEYDGDIIGSVELKAPRSMNKNCMVPLMLQLLKIQHYQQNPRQTYTGILTDGYKYVVIFLQGRKFTFEKEIIDGKNQIKIHRAKTWPNVMEIMNVLCAAVDRCIPQNYAQQHLTRKEPTPIVIDSDNESDDDIVEL